MSPDADCRRKMRTFRANHVGGSDVQYVEVRKSANIARAFAVEKEKKGKSQLKGASSGDAIASFAAGEPLRGPDDCRR